MESFDRLVTIRINVADSRQLTNAELDAAFMAVEDAISVELDAGGCFDAARERLPNTEVDSVVLIKTRRRGLPD